MLNEVVMPTPRNLCRAPCEHDRDDGGDENGGDNNGTRPIQKRHTMSRRSIRKRPTSTTEEMNPAMNELTQEMNTTNERTRIAE